MGRMPPPPSLGEPTIHAGDDEGLAGGGHGLVTIGEGGHKSRVGGGEVGEVGHDDGVSQRSGKPRDICGLEWW